MASYKINPFAITYEQIQNNLRVMIANNQDTFTDFFNDGSGSTVVDTAAALGAFFAYHIIAQRKEYTLEQATNYKSLIGNAYDKGYNVKRGRNLRLRLTATPRNTGSKQAWANLGQYADYDITLIEPTSYTLGIPVKLDVVIGNRASESIIANSNYTQLFRFVSDDVTDDVRLFLNEDEIPDYSTDIKDLLNDKYVMLSNSYGSVNVFYLQQGERKYKVGDFVTLDYIVRNSVTLDSLAVGNFSLPDFEVTSMELLQAREPIELKDDIRINASLHSETEGIIRSRADFAKVLKEFEPTIASISDEDIQPGRIGIYILKDDMQPLTESDKIKYQNTVKAKTVSGVANTIYEDASKYIVPLKVRLTALETTGTSQSLLTNINQDLLNYQYNIGATVDFDDIEKYIEEQEGIKIARIIVPTSAWEKRTYRISDTCISSNFNDKTYYVSGFNLTTGSITPNWESMDENGYIVDNNILWKEFEGNPEGIMIWKPNISVKLGRLIVDTLDIHKRVFECVGFVTKSSSVAPQWDSVINYVIDNNIVWEPIEFSANVKQYKPNSIYRIGDDIRVDISEDSNNPIYKYFRVIDYAMSTGDSEPNWEGPKTADGYIEDGPILLWSETSYPIRFIKLANKNYAEFKSEIEVE